MKEKEMDNRRLLHLYGYLRAELVTHMQTQEDVEELKRHIKDIEVELLRRLGDDDVVAHIRTEPRNRKKLIAVLDHGTVKEAIAEAVDIFSIEVVREP